MNIAGQESDILRLAGHLAQQGVEYFIDGLPLGFSLRQQGFVAGVRLNNMVDQRPGCRLAAFVKPVVRQYRRVVRPPDAADKARLLGDRHMTRRGTANQRHAPIEIRHFARDAAGSQRAEGTCMGIDNRHAHRGAGDQPHLTGGTLRQAVAERFAHGFNVAANFLRVVLKQILEPNLAEIAAVPLILVAHVGPFADRRAERACIVIRGAPGKEIRQIKIVTRVGPGIRHVLLQPQQLRGLHLRGDNSPDVVQHAMVQGVDAIGLGNGAVIHPDDNILLAAPGGADRQRLTLFIQHHQRAGSVEPQAFHLNGIDIRLIHRIAHRVAYHLPDIVGGLLNEISLRTIHFNGPAGLTDHSAVKIKHARPGAPCAYVHTNEVTRHNLFS